MFSVFRNVNCLQRKVLLSRISTSPRVKSLTNGNQTSKGTSESTLGPPPTPPPLELCCRSGCQNCVWLEYLNDMIQYYKNDKEQARKALDQIPDESVKAFIRLELGL